MAGERAHFGESRPGDICCLETRSLSAGPVILFPRQKGKGERRGTKCAKGASVNQRARCLERESIRMRNAGCCFALASVSSLRSSFLCVGAPSKRISLVRLYPRRAGCHLSGHGRVTSRSKHPWNRSSPVQQSLRVADHARGARFSWMSRKPGNTGEARVASSRPEGLDARRGLK